jgi:hypothetical protein
LEDSRDYVFQKLVPPHWDIHKTYDLNGSTVEYPEEKATRNLRAVLKDLNQLWEYVGAWPGEEGVIDKTA